MTSEREHTKPLFVWDTKPSRLPEKGRKVASLRRLNRSRQHSRGPT